MNKHTLEYRATSSSQNTKKHLFDKKFEIMVAIPILYKTKNFDKRKNFKITKIITNKRQIIS